MGKRGSVEKPSSTNVIPTDKNAAEISNESSPDDRDSK